MHLIRRWGLLLMVFAALVFGAVQVRASLVVGIRGDTGLYIQEYWRDGVPRLAVYNTGVDSLILSAVRMARGKQRSSPARGGAVVMSSGLVKADTLATWHLAPLAVALLPAVGVPDRLLSEERLVSLYGPHNEAYGIWADAGMRRPAIRGPVPESGIVTYADLNVPGNRFRDVWVVQDRLWYESGEGFKLNIVLASGTGILELRRGEAWPELPDVVILEAQCATLEVTDSDEVIQIDALGAGQDHSLHHVLVSCVAPDVEQPMMAYVAGRLRVDPGFTEEGFYRGILVRPKEATGDPPAN